MTKAQRRQHKHANVARAVEQGILASKKQLFCTTQTAAGLIPRAQRWQKKIAQCQSKP